MILHTCYPFAGLLAPCSLSIAAPSGVRGVCETVSTCQATNMSTPTVEIRHLSWDRWAMLLGQCSVEMINKCCSKIGISVRHTYPRMKHHGNWALTDWGEAWHAMWSLSKWHAKLPQSKVVCSIYYKYMYAVHLQSYFWHVSLTAKARVYETVFQ